MSDGKSYLDSFATSGKPESFEPEKFQLVEGGRRRTRIIVSIVIAAVVLFGVLGLYISANNVKVPELVGMTLDEASVWAAKNRIILTAKNLYDFEMDAGSVLSQEVAAGEKVRKNSALTIEVSLGADPAEPVEWPDIKTMTQDEIEDWISENKLTGVKIATANSDVVPAGEVISYTLTDGTEDNFVRKSRATVNVSLGSATQSDTVVVTDFSNMKAAAVLQWGSDNNVKIELGEAFDLYVASGSVVSQSVKATTEIKRTETITVMFSKGKPIVVPDFSTMTQAEATSWGKANNVTLTTLSRYSSQDNEGRLTSQSVAADTSVRAGDEIRLTYSLGRVDVTSFVGKTKIDFMNWLKGVNANGADLTISFGESYGEKGSVGKIISQSVKNDFVSPGSRISAVVSLGMKVLTPDFSGKTVAECTSLAQSSGITVLFDYQASDTVGRGLVITQSPARDAIITDATPVTVVVSSSESAASIVTVPDFSNMKAAAILQWSVDNGVTVNMSQEYSAFVANGSVLYQTPSKNTVIQKTDTVTVVLSKGPAPVMVTLPDFGAMTKDEANLWGKANGFTLTYVDQYNNSLAKGSLFGQSIAAGTSVAQGTDIMIHSSLGQVDIASYVGKTKLDIITWLNTINAKGANITATYTYANDMSKSMNVVVGQSIMNTFVDTGTTIVFTLSWE